MSPSLDGDGLHETAVYKVQWSYGFLIRLPLMSTFVEPGAGSRKSSTARPYLILIP